MIAARQAMARVRPELVAARRAIADALDRARETLTEEQWERVPVEVRKPFRAPAVRPGGPGAPGDPRNPGS